MNVEVPENDVARRFLVCVVSAVVAVYAVLVRPLHLDVVQDHVPRTHEVKGLSPSRYNRTRFSLRASYPDGRIWSASQVLEVVAARVRARVNHHRGARSCPSCGVFYGGERIARASVAIGVGAGRRNMKVVRRQQAVVKSCRCAAGRWFGLVRLRSPIVAGRGVTAVLSVVLFFLNGFDCFFLVGILHHPGIVATFFGCLAVLLHSFMPGIRFNGNASRASYSSQEKKKTNGIPRLHHHAHGNTSLVGENHTTKHIPWRTARSRAGEQLRHSEARKARGQARTGRNGCRRCSQTSDRSNAVTEETD